MGRTLTARKITWRRVCELERRVAKAGCGACATFLGIVRPDRSSGRTVEALTYEAYPAMAEREIDRLVAKAKARWPLVSVGIEHRLGRVDVGGVSVAVVTASRHRAHALAATKFLIDGIKKRAPIWKCEHYDNGTSAWSRS